MTVGQNQAVHRNAHAGGNVAEHLCSFQQVIFVDIESGQLFGVFSQLGEAISRIAGEAVKVLKNLIRAVNVLEHISERHSLNLKLAGNVNKGFKETTEPNDGKRHPRKLGQRAEDGFHVGIFRCGLPGRAGVPLLEYAGALNLGSDFLLLERGLGNFLGRALLGLTHLFSIDNLLGRFGVQPLFEI
ncbi:MAG: hypothetical protein IKT34_02160, partial [Clostridia bacterium]|nr:hypothetical protein [Clostridia bacterium]